MMKMRGSMLVIMASVISLAACSINNERSMESTQSVVLISDYGDNSIPGGQQEAATGSGQGEASRSLEDLLAELDQAIIPGPDWSQAAIDSYAESLNQIRLYCGWTVVETSEPETQTAAVTDEAPFFKSLARYKSNYAQFFLETGSDAEKTAAQKYFSEHGTGSPRKIMVELGRISVDAPRLSAEIVEMAWNDYVSFVEDEISQGNSRSNHSFTIAFAEMLNRYVGGPDSQGEMWIRYHVDDSRKAYYMLQYGGTAVWYVVENGDGTKMSTEIHSAKEVADMYPPVEPTQTTTSEWEYVQWLFGPDTDLFDSYYERGSAEQRQAMLDSRDEYAAAHHLGDDKEYYTLERLLKVIMGEIPEDQPRLSLQEALRFAAEIKGDDTLRWNRKTDRDQVPNLAAVWYVKILEAGYTPDVVMRMHSGIQTVSCDLRDGAHLKLKAYQEKIWVTVYNSDGKEETVYTLLEIYDLFDDTP